MKALFPPDEAQRLKALRQYDILDTPVEAVFDELTLLAAQICQAPLALVSFVDENRQWFKSGRGVGVSETPRDIAFCAHAILGKDEVFEVRDARTDPRFAGNPLVTSGPRICFYAGAPLVTSDGHALGALCVMDQKPRNLSVEQTAALQTLSRQVVAALEARRHARELTHEIAERERAEFMLRQQNEHLLHGERETTRLLAVAEKSRGALLSVLEDEQQAGKNLRESEERFRQLAENIQEVFWITDLAKNEMLYVSPAYEAIWGRTCGSLYAAPRTWHEAIHEEDRERVLDAAVSRQMEGAYDEEYRIVRPDGEVRWIRDRAFPVRNAQGEVYRVAGVAKDITARKRDEDQLREQASLLDKAQDAILVRDLDNRITYWNKSAERLYGWTSGEAIGHSSGELLYKDTSEFDAACSRLFEAGEWVGELRQMTKDGTPLIIEGHWTLVRDAAGQPRSILAINTDITQQKSIEHQFLRAQRMESLGALAGGIAHDLNNVLTPITMAIDFLRLKVTDPKCTGVLDTIAGSAKRGADMVGQVLSFARGMEGRRVGVQPRHIITDIEKICCETFPKNIQIKTFISPGLWSIQGDPTQLHQVLLNLCVNGRDAMPRGGRLNIHAKNVTLDAQSAAMNIDATPGLHVVIEVEDTGTGIADEIIGKLFDPFFTTKDLGKGTGLGLSTSLSIVKSHGGFLRVESELGKGTRFSIHLPASVGAQSAAPGDAVIESPRGNGETVLVVDDEAFVRQITRQTLEAFGYHVMHASDGAEAVSLYAQHRDEVTVVLMDMMMPVMDGASSIVVLRKMNPDLRIIASSGITSERNVEKADHAGVKHFLPKPYTAHALLKVLRQILEGRS